MPDSSCYQSKPFFTVLFYFFLIFFAAAAFLLEHPSLEGDTPPAKKRRSVSNYRDVDRRGEVNSIHVYIAQEQHKIAYFVIPL